MLELSINIEKECQEHLERVARRFHIAFQVPTQDPELAHFIREQTEVFADRLVAGLQGIHSRNLPSFTGRSYNSIKRIPWVMPPPGAEGRLIDFSVAIGYFPSAGDLTDTSVARNVQAYFGGVVGERSIIGPILKGLEPGQIRAPTRGGGGKGTFGGGGWSRLAAYLAAKGSPKYGTAGIRKGAKLYRYPDRRQDVWAVIRSLEKKGMRGIPIIEDFYNEIVPRERGRYRANISNAIRRWWERLRA